MEDLIKRFEKITESKVITSTDVSKIIVARLCVERIGEIDHNSWWQSRTLAPFGNAKLKEMLPKTHVVAKIKIAFKIVHKKEQDLINEKNYLSLYRLTPEIEKLIDSVIHASDEKISDYLDSSLDSFIFNATNLTESEMGRIDTQRELIGHKMGAFSLGEIDESLISNEKINQLIDFLIYAWSKNRKGQLLIPYYRLKK